MDDTGRLARLTGCSPVRAEHTWKLAKKTAVQEEWLGDIEEEQKKHFQNKMLTYRPS